MGRMIDSQTAYDVLTDYYHHSTDAQHAALREALGRVESVDAVPVVHGRWINETFKAWGLVHHPYKCDQCGYHNEAPSDYCPDCGARMDGKDGENNDTV